MFLSRRWLFLQRAAQFSTPALGIPNLLYYLPATDGMVLMTLVAIERAIAAAGARGRRERRVMMSLIAVLLLFLVLDVHRACRSRWRWACPRRW